MDVREILAGRPVVDADAERAERGRDIGAALLKILETAGDSPVTIQFQRASGSNIDGEPAPVDSYKVRVESPLPELGIFHQTPNAAVRTANVNRMAWSKMLQELAALFEEIPGDNRGFLEGPRRRLRRIPNPGHWSELLYRIERTAYDLNGTGLRDYGAYPDHVIAALGELIAYAIACTDRMGVNPSEAVRARFPELFDARKRKP